MCAGGGSVITDTSQINFDQFVKNLDQQELKLPHSMSNDASCDLTKILDEKSDKKNILSDDMFSFDDLLELDK